MSGPISKVYGPETVTTYSGNLLNRLSFLREDQTFLAAALKSPDARFLAFKKFNPLVRAASSLEWLTLSKLDPNGKLLGEPYSQNVDERARNWDPERDASGASTAQLVFLGVDESVPSSFKYRAYSGAPRFAVDVSQYPQTLPPLRQELESFYERVTGSMEDVEFMSVMFGVNLTNPLEFSVVAEARSILDWINRIRYCAGCGRRNMVIWGGFKMLCPTSYTGETECPTKGALTNISFPRTDCCMIAAVVSHDGSKVLVGRGARFRVNMYSCLAGFLESGESIEDCVRREIMEEAGVKVGRVIMHSSQPWPYPGNIMVGCLAEVADASPESHTINLGHDKELVDAKWVSKEDMRLLCSGEADFDYSIPPPTAIAWNLLKRFADS